MANNYLIEIGTEELPPTSLKVFSNAFSDGIEKALTDKKLTFSAAKRFATPRRLALVIEELAEFTPLEKVKAWGPPAKIAFDKDGNPSKAAEAFAKKNGVTVADLTTENDGKADKLVALLEAGGEKTVSILGDIVKQALTNLPIPKRMRWGSSREEFVRPVQWITLLQDSTILDETILGIKSGNQTRGHRFHCPDHFTITNPLTYEQQLLEQGHIVASFEQRQALIKSQVEACAQKINGVAVIDEELLNEVTGLVEWPVALAGKFDEDFLSVPAEALISSMKEHQKYFHVVDKNHSLLPNFITVSNIESKDPAQVIDGNERVIRPRLSDAAFFYSTDKQTSLEAKRDKLKTVVFQAKLGTVFDKTERIKSLAHFIAEQLNIDVNHTTRAAELCKSDLVSHMVYEFPDMQGIAGSHYATHDGESAEVSAAIVEQYQPRFAGDNIPASDVGALIALADRLDTIVGIFGIGQTPTGSKDPFALRRASLGVLRILVEKKYDLDLRVLITEAANAFSELPKADTVVDNVLSYMLERFRAWYEEASIAPEIFQSVSAVHISCPLDINNRVYAVSAFTQLDSAKALAAANKRVSNILAKQKTAVASTYDAALFVEPAEKQLAAIIESTKNDVAPLFAQHDYTTALSKLAVLREPVDAFFDDVMVMADDIAIRNNRLSLLQLLRNLFLQVADISYLDVK